MGAGSPAPPLPPLLPEKICQKSQACTLRPTLLIQASPKVPPPLAPLCSGTCDAHESDDVYRCHILGLAFIIEGWADSVFLKTSWSTSGRPAPSAARPA